MSIEPDPTNFEHLKCNIRLNGVDNRVILVNGTGYSKDGEVKPYIDIRF